MLQQISTLTSSTQSDTLAFLNPDQIDQLTYSSESITFEKCDEYKLTKEDLILYCEYIISWNVVLLDTFLNLVPAVNTAVPVSSFKIEVTSDQQITYTQTANGQAVICITYYPSELKAVVSSRGSPISISYQEFFLMVYLLNQYINQVKVS